MCSQVLIVYSAENATVLAGPTDFQHFFGILGPPYNGLSDTYCEPSIHIPPRHMLTLLWHPQRSSAHTQR